MTPLRLPAGSVHVAQTALLAVAPSGWQSTARRNAWAGMAEAAAVARTRREAEQALTAAGHTLPSAQAR